MLNNKSILITGGTGSFGQQFVETILKKYPKIKRLVVFSRDELKQYKMSNKFTTTKYPFIRYFLGDVRDRKRLARALMGIDIVVHAAALKQVPAAEYNPMEFIYTNVIGAQNLIESSIDMKVKQIVALSTDKAAAPINLYGATKLCSDKLFIAANNYSGLQNMKFSVVRYGNVMSSRGSVIPLFEEKKETGVLPITHKDMTRFGITLEQGIDMVLWTIKNNLGGEIFVPKIPSFKIVDLAKIVAPKCKLKVIGRRKGEKIHEELITESDGYMTFDLGSYYVILSDNSKATIKKYKSKFKNFSQIQTGFSYNSRTNKDFFNIKDLKKYLIKNKLIS